MKKWPKNIRAVAAVLLSRVVLGKQSLDTALAELDQAPSRPEQASSRALVQEMVYGCLRWHGYLDEIAGKLLAKNLKRKDQDLRLLLLVGLYQLEHLSIKEHAVVSETVSAATDLGKGWAKGLINGCLRKFQRDRQSIIDEIDKEIPDAQLSHPAWLLQELQSSWPKHWPEIVTANNQKPPMHLRVNLARLSRESAMTHLAEQDMDCKLLSTPCGIGLIKPVPVPQLPDFPKGDISVQDQSAQLAATLLAPKPGERLLDACAAPGGKTGHLLELVDGQASLVALEIDPERANRIRENLQRLRYRAEVTIGDAAKPDTWWDGKPFDRILLDAPCSATGVIRRHPDIKHLRQPDDVDRLVQTQASLLDALWPLLRQGGKLLYATCSILRRENDQQIKNFLERFPEATEVALDLSGDADCRHGVQLLPGEGDGFYYCLLEKS